MVPLQYFYTPYSHITHCIPYTSFHISYLPSHFQYSLLTQTIFSSQQQISKQNIEPSTIKAQYVTQAVGAKFPSLSQAPVKNQQQSEFIYSQIEEKRLNRNIKPLQKFGRNILSNIFLTMIRFLLKSKEMKNYIQKVILTHNMVIHLNQFYSMIKKKTSKLGAYVNYATIASFLKNPKFTTELTLKNVKELQFCKIFRIVAKLYVINHHTPYVYNTNKIKSQSKQLHVKIIRRILQI